MDTIEGNKLIAEFMGVLFTPYKDNHSYNVLLTYQECKKYIQDNMLKGYEPKVGWKKDLIYHSSWDWLMPVVKKILDLNNMQELYKRITRITESLIYLDIALLFEEVVSFIKWYNSQPK